MKPTKPTAAIVLAAGESKRFRSARSKVVHPLGGRPMIQWPLAALRKIGADPIVVVVGRESEEVRRACGKGIAFAVQGEPRGTGHAVLAAERAVADFRGDLLVVNCDLPALTADTLQRLVDEHRSSGGVLTILTAKVADPFGWGRIVRRSGAMHAIVEERDADQQQRAIREVNVGVYCAAPDILFSLLRRVTPDNAQREIYLTDVVGRAIEAGIHVATAGVEEREVGQINNRRELAHMEKTLRSQVIERWMTEGVTFEDPETAYVGPDVEIGRDTVIGPNVHLRGRTVLGEECRLDGSAFLTDVVLADRVHLKFGVVATESRIGSGCVIGPFAHLRPATRLADDVHIGDFVETKNAAIGARSKANHLAYLGDVEVGTDSNIGAGTITCNYDGFAKHKTVIGDRVQVGSDTTLVAPVKLGDDAYVATATTVRKDVQPGALVFNSREQVHRAGWVAARRARAAKDRATPPSGAHPTPRGLAAKPAKTSTAKVARLSKVRSKAAGPPAGKKKARR